METKQHESCCSCMTTSPSNSSSSTVWDTEGRLPVPNGELSSPSSYDYSTMVNDPVEHRLHCQVSDCVQCRCDSGYMPLLSTITSNPSCHNCGINRQGLFNSRSNCPLITSSSSSSLSSSSTSDASSHHNHQYHQNHPPSHSPNHLRCEYCGVCTMECCSRLCSVCKNLRRRRKYPVDEHADPAVSQNQCSCASSRYSLSTSSNDPLVSSATQRCSCPVWSTSLATSFQQLMSYFTGRVAHHRPHRRRLLKTSSLFRGWERMTSFLYTMITVATFCLSFLPVSDGCSSRSTPKPRTPSTTLRPNITIQTYTCPPEYDLHYCLNGATCFTVKIGESILFNCECAEGYMGQRCEFKDLDGSYLPAKQRAMLEQAGLTSGAAIIVVIVVIVCFYLYVRSRRKLEISQRMSTDEVDARTYMDYENERRPFSPSHYFNSPPNTLSQTNQNLLLQPPRFNSQNPTNNANPNPTSTITAVTASPYQQQQPLQHLHHHPHQHHHSHVPHHHQPPVTSTTTPQHQTAP